MRSRRERRGRARAGGRGLAWPAAILATIAATLVRLWFPGAWGETTTPGSVFYEGDARAFLDFAAHLVAGIPFDNGVPFHPPGWPFLLSLWYRLNGWAPLDGVPADPAAVKAFVALVSGLSVGGAVLLAWRLAGSGAALAVALLGPFHFGHIVQGSVPNSEALYGLLLVAVLLVACRWCDLDAAPARSGVQTRRPPNGRYRVAAATGISAACASLVRAEFVLAAVLLPALRWWSPAGRTKRVSEIAAYGVGIALTLAPSTLWHWQGLAAFNHTRAGRMPGPLPAFAPITSYGPFNFATANHEDADGGPNRDHPLLSGADALLDQGQLDLASPPVYRLFIDGYALGVAWIRAHPRDALHLVWRKTAIASGAFAHGYLHDNLGAGVDGVRRRVDLLDPAGRRLWGVHVALIVAGAWMLGRRAPAQAALLAIPVLTLAASAALFFGYVRLGVAYAPVFWVFQGVALSAVARVPWPAAVRRRPAVGVLAVGAALLIIVAAGRARPRAVSLEGQHAPDGRLLLDETVTVSRLR